MFVNYSQNWTVPKSMHISKNSQLVYGRRSLFHDRQHTLQLCSTHSPVFIVSVSLIQSLFPCSSSGSVCLQWICLMLCYGQDEMACYLHPILCTWDAVVTCTLVPVFFPLRVWLSSGKKKRRYKLIFKVPTRLRQELT